MRKLSQLMGILLVTSFLSGCFIQSFQPFYTDDLVLDIPAIEGKWSLVKKGKEDVADNYPQPWEFTDDAITTFEHNVSSILEATYFKVADVTFLDLAPSEPDEDKGPNEWWTIHTVPVHSVCKVDLSTNALSLTPLNGEWVEEMLEEKKISLSYISVGSDDDQIVLTSSAKELVVFLKQYGSNTNAFPVGVSHHFKRPKDTKTE
ncbi:hypothetical protein ACFLQU_04895 [Verrucomicrobiota bacterium]